MDGATIGCPAHTFPATPSACCSVSLRAFALFAERWRFAVAYFERDVA
jgi:hypothetical protein